MPEAKAETAPMPEEGAAAHGHRAIKPRPMNNGASQPKAMNCGVSKPKAMNYGASQPKTMNSGVN